MSMSMSLWNSQKPESWTYDRLVRPTAMASALSGCAGPNCSVGADRCAGADRGSLRTERDAQRGDDAEAHPCRKRRRRRASGERVAGVGLLPHFAEKPAQNRRRQPGRRRCAASAADVPCGRRLLDGRHTVRYRGRRIHPDGRHRCLLSGVEGPAGAVPPPSARNPTRRRLRRRLRARAAASGQARSRAGRFGSNVQPSTRYRIAAASSRDPSPSRW